MKMIFALLIILITSSFQQTFASESDWSIGIGSSGLQFKNSKKNESSLFYSAYYLYENRDSSIRDSTDHQLGIEIGYRSYLDVSEYNKFMDTSFQYVNIDNDNFNDFKIYRLKMMYGVENYMSENLSIEGSTGVYINFEEYGDTKSTSLFAPATRISVNYRF